MSTIDENSQFEEMKKLFEALAALGGREDAGTEEDVMPEGYGEFGLEVTNPVPVNSILGNQLYLERLRTLKGTKVTYNRIGSVRASNIKSIIDAYTVYADGKETKIYICPYNKKNSGKAPKGFKLEPEQSNTPHKQEPIFFDIPKPGAAHQQNPPPLHQPKPLSPKKQQKAGLRTTINGVTFRGGILWAAVRYFFLGLVIPFGLLAIMEYQWQLLSAPPSNKFITAIPYAIVVLALWFTTNGIVALFVNRFRPFAEFLLFAFRTGLAVLFFRCSMIVFQLETLPTAARVVLFILVFGALLVALNNVSRLKSNEDIRMNSAMLRLGGTPVVIFFTYLLRALMTPLIIVGILYIFNLSPNTFWKAVFAIGGALWTFELVRIALRCTQEWISHTIPEKPLWITRIVILLNFEYLILYLPGFGYFLMWYFNWLPMKSWVIWIYGIYGFFALWLNLGFLSSTLRK